MIKQSNSRLKIVERQQVSEMKEIRRRMEDKFEGAEESLAVADDNYKPEIMMMKTQAGMRGPRGSPGATGQVRRKLLKYEIATLAQRLGKRGFWKLICSEVRVKSLNSNSNPQNGILGSRGRPGGRGVRGPSGLPGPRGPKGAKGKPGIFGKGGGRGPPGVSGPAGAKGRKGGAIEACPGGDSAHTRLRDCNRAACRVEVFHDGKWGSVCGDSFGTKDAEVVCNSMVRISAHKSQAPLNLTLIPDPCKQGMNYADDDDAHRA